MRVERVVALRVDGVDDVPPFAVAPPNTGAAGETLPRNLIDATRIGACISVGGVVSDAGQAIANDEIWQMILLRNTGVLDREVSIVVEPVAFELPDRSVLPADGGS